MPDVKHIGGQVVESFDRIHGGAETPGEKPERISGLDGVLDRSGVRRGRRVFQNPEISIIQGTPGGGADDSIRIEPHQLLKGDHGLLGLRVENAILCEPGNGGIKLADEA